jgi:hypothetical protein
MALQTKAHLFLSILTSWLCWALFEPAGTLVYSFVIMTNYFMGLSWSLCGVPMYVITGSLLYLPSWLFLLFIVIWAYLCWECSYVFAYPWAGPMRFVAFTPPWFINGYTTQSSK